MWPTTLPGTLAFVLSAIVTIWGGIQGVKMFLAHNKEISIIKSNADLVVRTAGQVADLITKNIEIDKQITEIKKENEMRDYKDEKIEKLLDRLQEKFDEVNKMIFISTAEKLKDFSDKFLK